MLYFAYGSNMCTGRLRQRVRSASQPFVARLAGHTLRFHKRSTDGSGKADAFSTGVETDCVWGVVFEIDEAEKPLLDVAEGAGKGYHEEAVTVTDAEGGRHPVFVYIADASHIDANRRPYSWYKRFVVEGAHQHGLPRDYLVVLEATRDVEDPDRTRDARKRAILCD